MSSHEKIKDYIYENAEYGLLKTNYTHIGKDLDINPSVVHKVFQRLIEEKEVEIVEKPTRGRHAKEGLFKLLKGTQWVRLEFGGIKLHIRLTEIGYVMGKHEFAKAILEDITIIDTKIQKNSELFVDNIIVLDGETYLNSTAIMSVIIKIDLDDCLPIKRQYVTDFQKLVAERMVETVIHAKCAFTDDDRIHIRNNLSEITEIKKEDLEEVFKSLENDMSNIVGQYIQREDGYRHKLDLKNKEVEQTKNREQRTRGVNSKLRNEISDLKGKLLNCKTLA